MKISKEVKTALVIITGIVFFIFGFNFLKGQNIFEDARVYYVIYDNVNGLEVSAPVTINGLKVGKVTAIDFSKENSGKLLVTLTVDHDFVFSKNSTAELYDAGLIGGKAVAIIPANDNADPAKEETYLKSDVKIGITQTVLNKLTPIQEKLEHTLISLDTLASSINKILNKDTRTHLKQGVAHLDETLQNFKEASATLNNMLAENSQKIGNSLENIEHMSANFSTLSDSLSNAQIGKTLATLQTSINKFDAIVTAVNNGEGSIGKLLHEDALYNNLEGTSRQLEQLLQDFKLNPKRYVHFSVFGKKPNEYNLEENKEEDPQPQPAEN